VRRVRGRDGSSNLIPVPVPDFWLSGKTRTRTHTRSTRVLPVKVGTDSGRYPRVRVFLPCLILPNILFFNAYFIIDLNLLKIIKLQNRIIWWNVRFTIFLYFLTNKNIQISILKNILLAFFYFLIYIFRII